MARFAPFQKHCSRRSQLCRTALIRSALESTNPGVSNDVSDAVIWLLRTDTLGQDCCVIGFSIGKNSDREILFCGSSSIWNAMMSAPSGRISTSQSSLEAPGSGLSSALRISVARHKCNTFPENQAKMSVLEQNAQVAWIILVQFFFANFIRKKIKF